MAQVQQYLDADTREQYAQGHLDSRVEQVLQEIRELSISGTGFHWHTLSLDFDSKGRRLGELYTIAKPNCKGMSMYSSRICFSVER
ncbi:hypothetical protein EYC84_007575 [Monilinia fructicola]|nr:hypothetical protein EYC84_007575 [Monilinia fructicola]